MMSTVVISFVGSNLGSGPRELDSDWLTKFVQDKSTNPLTDIPPLDTRFRKNKSCRRAGNDFGCDILLYRIKVSALMNIKICQALYCFRSVRLQLSPSNHFLNNCPCASG